MSTKEPQGQVTKGSKHLGARVVEQFLDSLPEFRDSDFFFFLFFFMSLCLDYLGGPKVRELFLLAPMHSGSSNPVVWAKRNLGRRVGGVLVKPRHQPGHLNWCEGSCPP